MIIMMITATITMIIIITTIGVIAVFKSALNRSW